MIHVAILLKPYLDLILQGKKTVESRLTKDARDPFENIEPGERIYFKQSSGPFMATAIADHVLFESNLTPKRINEIRRDYNDQICGETSYWNWKRGSRYCTLIWLRDVSGAKIAKATPRGDAPVFLRVEGASTNNIQVTDTDLSRVQQVLVTSAEVNRHAVVVKAATR